MKEHNVEQLKLETLQMIDKYFMPTKAIIVKAFLNTYRFWVPRPLQNITEIIRVA